MEAAGGALPRADPGAFLAPHTLAVLGSPVQPEPVWSRQAVCGAQVHLAAEAMGLLTAGMLLALGFRMHRVQGFTYWLRAPRARRAAAASLSSAGSSESVRAPSRAASAASASPPSASSAGSPLPSRPASPAPGSRRGSGDAAGGLPPTEAVLAGAGLAAAEAAPLVFVHGVGLGLVRRLPPSRAQTAAVLMCPAGASAQASQLCLWIRVPASPVISLGLCAHGDRGKDQSLSPLLRHKCLGQPAEQGCGAHAGVVRRNRHPTCTSSRSCCARCRAGRWCCWRCARSA